MGPRPSGFGAASGVATTEGRVGQETANAAARDRGLGHQLHRAPSLLAGFAAECFRHDYGIDLFVHTYGEDGGIEPGPLLVQAKATDHLRILADQRTVAIRLHRVDLEWWLSEIVPVMLVVYDARCGVAYWLDVQSYFPRRVTGVLSGGAATVTVRLPMSNLLDATTFRDFARIKNVLVARGRHGS